jgi:hypothetical protein
MIRFTVIASLVLAVVVATVIGGMPHPAYAAGSCGDSWGSDGHSGPWYSGSGQTLHGNTLVIAGANCGSGTMWNVTYEVVKENPSTGQQFYPIMTVRNGDGPTSWSVSVSPVGCNQGWIYYTQVKNDLTGNWIRKPSSGLVIC